MNYKSFFDPFELVVLYNVWITSSFNNSNLEFEIRLFKKTNDLTRTDVSKEAYLTLYEWMSINNSIQQQYIIYSKTEFENNRTLRSMYTSNGRLVGNQIKSPFDIYKSGSEYKRFFRKMNDYFTKEEYNEINKTINEEAIGTIPSRIEDLENKKTGLDNKLKSRIDRIISNLKDLYNGEIEKISLDPENYISSDFADFKPSGEDYNGTCFKFGLSEEIQSNIVIKEFEIPKSPKNYTRIINRISLQIDKIWRLDLSEVRSGYGRDDALKKPVKYECELEFTGDFKNITFDDFAQGVFSNLIFVLSKLSHC
jgi:hypothetical protein